MSTRHWIRTLVAAALAALFPAALAWAQAANSLEEITATQLPGDKVQLTLRLSGPASEPASFSIDNPARIALDFPNTVLNLAAKTVPVNIGQVRSVTAAESKGRTRVVVNLAQTASYETRAEGSLVHVLVASGGDAVPVVKGAPAPASAAAGKSQAKEITNIDFRRGPKGQAIINVQLPSKKAVVDMRQEGGKIVLDMPGARLPSRLERTLDVMDFATPVQTVNARNKPGGAVIEVAMAGTPAIEHMAYQSNESYTLEVRPLTKAEQEQQAKKAEYTGEKLSLNFQDIEVRAVLQLLADFTGFNMVVSDNVTGNLTLRLKNVPWDQAMDIILKTKGLDKRQNGNVVYIAPAADIAAQEKLALEASRQITELAPLSSELMQVNFAKASDLAALLKAKENKLLSERGNVTVDARTNALLVQDTADRLADVRKLIAQLDKPTRQVLIESRIVLASDNFSKNLGVRFGYSRNDLFNSAENVVVIGGRQTGSQTFRSRAEGSAVTNPLDSGSGTAAPTAFNTSGAESLMVDLPAAGATSSIGLAVGKIGTYLLQLELQAAQSDGSGEVVSSPRLVTADQKEATIETGVEIPYQEASSSGATSTSFKKAVLSLKVKPQITPDERVIMDLAVNKDSVGAIYNGVPSINTQAVNTQVLVNNGETVVLGGVYERTNTNTITRTPFFGELPYVGWAFRNEAKIDNKSELLVFVTPKLIKDAAALN